MDSPQRHRLLLKVVSTLKARPMTIDELVDRQKTPEEKRDVQREISLMIGGGYVEVRHKDFKLVLPGKKPRPGNVLSEHDLVKLYNAINVAEGYVAHLPRTSRVKQDVIDGMNVCIKYGFHHVGSNPVYLRKNRRGGRRRLPPFSRKQLDDLSMKPDGGTRIHPSLPKAQAENLRLELGTCRSDNDGDCVWKNCPQLKTYRTICPLYERAEDEC